jgi:hypothetical protein
MIARSRLSLDVAVDPQRERYGLVRRGDPGREGGCPKACRMFRV